MIKATRQFGKVLRKTAFAFLYKVQKEKSRFDDDAYYLSLGTTLISLDPHYGWRKARAAARRIHHKAFIMKGSTVNRLIEQAQWSGHKNAWNHYAMPGK